MKIAHRPVPDLARPHARVALVLVLLAAAPSAPWASGGGGSAAIFSLDRDSPSGGPSTLYIDDAMADGMLTVALPGGALGIGGQNLDALSGGLDNGVLAAIGYVGMLPNPLHAVAITYVFSVGRDAVDETTGIFPVPFLPPGLRPFIERTDDFAFQFTTGDQASDLFRNMSAFTPPPALGRSNFRLIEDDTLELVGDLDNLDAFTSNGALSGPYDADGNLQLDGNGMAGASTRLYFSVEGGTVGLQPATIYRVIGNNAVGIPIPYAGPGMLGLMPLDDIDAISVWDSEPFGIFNGPMVAPPSLGDGVIFSLREGSPTLDGPNAVVGGVRIGEGGVFFAMPGKGIVAALPSTYFALDPGSRGVPPDELDAVMAVDPRVTAGLGDCMAPFGMGRVPAGDGSTVVTPSRVEVVPGPMGAAQVCVCVNDPTGLFPGGVVTSFTATAIATEGGTASIVAAGTTACGGPDGDCCFDCNSFTCPIGPGGEEIAGSFTGCMLETEGALFASYDTCVGWFVVSGLMPGITRFRIQVVGVPFGGPMGEPVVFTETELVVHVLGDCNVDGMDDLKQIGAGMLGDCDGNGRPDACEPDGDGDGTPDACEPVVIFVPNEPVQGTFTQRGKRP